MYGENIAAFHIARRVFAFDKSVYVGMSVLELSKTLMFSHHYDVMLSFYVPDKLTLLYTDTDSFIYLLRTDDLYRDKLTYLQHLDISDCPTDHPCYSVANTKVLGKFKDEARSGWWKNSSG